MQALLAVLTTWLSVHLGMPAVDEHPDVKFASAAEMSELHFDSLEAAAAADLGAGAAAGFRHDIEAIYDDRSRTIYLPEGWTGKTPAEVSVLVHELAHHLQNAAELSYDCPEAREKLAYQAQERWLELFATSLADEFAIDPMTLLVRTNCMH
jgi:hypothetical protein